MNSHILEEREAIANFRQAQIGGLAPALRGVTTRELGQFPETVEQMQLSLAQNLTSSEQTA